MKKEILKILRESKEYVSGQSICEKLNVSRTAIWKGIKQLKEEGYEIDAISNKGYHLIEVPDIVTAQEIESRINTEKIARKVLYYEEVESTNAIAKAKAEEENTDGLLVIANKQTAGKGRRGKTWESPSNTGIFMSLILKPDIQPKNASMLTLVTALGVSKAIKRMTDLECRIKWPNDIVVKGKKVCGILTEMSAELDYINNVVIGIGINANIEEFPVEINNIATSIAKECNHKIVRAELIVEIMKEIELYYNKFLETESLIELVEEYNALSVNTGKMVRIISNNEEYETKAIGINEKGELLVEDKINNSIKAIVSGEVSVRGIYGYV